MLLPVLAISQRTKVFVAVNGNDLNVGSAASPKASLHAALRQVRELRRLHDPSIQHGADIVLLDGTYQLDETVLVRPEDAGTAASPTYILAADNAKPVLSGGIPIKNWRKVTGKLPGLDPAISSRVLTADIPFVGGNPFQFRQLWVNGTKAVRARDRNGDSMSRILSWNKAEQACWIPVDRKRMPAIANAMEMVIIQWWAIANLRIKNILIQGDSAKLSFHQPESRVQSEHPWPAPWISKETGNSAFYLVNDISFLDEPGEWYADTRSNKIYYFPRINENINTINVVAPYLETLVRMEGSADHTISHIHFKGITFSHTGWLRPSQQGHVPHQAGMYMLDAYKLKQPGTPDKKTLENQAWVGRPAAAIKALFVSNTSFEDCRFEHLASTGLDYEQGSKNDLIRGNLFKDIGGTAVLAGIFSDEATEVHLPYNPADERVLCDGISIHNNVINDVTNEDWGCVGIGAGYVRNAAITHNEICDVNYMGISVGWGWTKTINAMRNNLVQANYIHHYGKQLTDVAAIYTLSAQPGTIISANRIDSIYKAPYAHLPEHWFYLYCDEGSSYMTVRDNWTPSEKYLQNANGPGNTWQNNGAAVADSIKHAAGVEPAFRHLLDAVTINRKWPVTKEKPFVLELITDAETDAAAVKVLLMKSNVDTQALYIWKNHYVIYGRVQDLYVLRDRLRSNFAGAQVKVYEDLVYEFNRDRCGDTHTAASWDHILLTADLVADPKLQAEYVAYHATQFEKWPEVAKGFCNASFQQLRVFRNGQQLMLVISIPKGASLDQLNPKTTENNPRVDEWNALMKKYQTGIAGTKPGEVWVFLQQQ